MHHKIYISVIIILVSLLSWISYSTIFASDSIKANSDTLRQLMASETEVILADGTKWKACNVRVNDKETNILIAAHRFVISKDGTCPALPGDYYISKEEYIKEIQTKKGWGIFDNNSIYYDAIEK